MLVVLSLGACQPQNLSITPPSPLETWQVEYTPALRWLSPFLQGCTTGLSGIVLEVSERPAVQLGSSQADFSFQWGERAVADGFSAVMGHDSLVVVVNRANPVSKLTPDEVQRLFSGKAVHWNLASGTSCTSCGPDFDGVVQTYGYAPGEDIRVVASWIPTGPETLLVPGPAEVRAAVAKERYSGGYLPARWLDATVRAVAISNAEPGLLERPVLVFAPGEPRGAQRAWLACVREAIQ